MVTGSKSSTASGSVSSIKPEIVVDGECEDTEFFELFSSRTIALSIQLDPAMSAQSDSFSSNKKSIAD